MLFYEPPFFVLFALVFPLNYLLRGNARVSMLLIASYIFYMWFDWRFLSLLLLSSVVDFVVGLLLVNPANQNRRKLILTVSIVANLGVLGFFKYFNFFIDSFVAAFNIPESQRFFVEVILPPGISFYTFQTMSYTIDVYRRKVPAERSLLLFSTFVAFFPHMVAGPIVRPKILIPQLERDPRFNWANIYSGSRLFLIGCFKKIVIADNLSPISDAAFTNPSAHTSLGLMIAAYCFAIQIYCDFSGYTDMARGIAKTLGINLSLNFNLPYLASSLNDFWRRWHMTLSYWLRDYCYIPLGGSRHGLLMHCRNLMITFTLSGLWHGASWSFILWGMLHGAWIIGELLLGRAFAWRPPKWVAIAITFHVVVLLWVLFRAQSLSVAMDFYRNMLTTPVGLFSAADRITGLTLAFYALPLVVFSLWQYTTGTLTPDVRWRNRVLHGALMGALAFLTIILGAQGGSQFIYFQF